MENDPLRQTYVPRFPNGWDQHRLEQIRHIAANTTPEQRFAWLEGMIELLRPQLPQLLANRRKLEDLEDEKRMAEIQKRRFDEAQQK